ncbi:SSF domain containing protein, partial [Asbolus verrucosus]
MATHIASELEANMKHFKWPDCVILTIMLLICVLIGLYFGIYRGYTNVQEYLMGGRKMKIFPITVSLVASYISAISILGIPTDIYLYGVHYLYSLGGFTLMIFIMNYIYLPVFYGLNLTSVYEYLERRFNKKVKLFGSLLYIINMILWSPMAIYVSALTFSQVTDVNVHVITPVLCTICAFYTSLGGVKAVVYTDVIQSTIMFAAMVLVAIIGTINVGGLYTVLARNLESGRIEGPNLDFNLSSKYTIWSLIVGGSINYLQIASINQNMLQRYLALPSISHAKKAVWFFVLEFCAFFLVCGYCGLLIYATFYKCNPLSTKLVKEKDQLLPLLAMQVLGDYPGLPGIFVAGILSASLSTPLTEKQSFIVMKLTVVIFGVICVGMVYIIEQLGAILQ